MTFDVHFESTSDTEWVNTNDTEWISVFVPYTRYQFSSDVRKVAFSASKRDTTLGK